MKVLIAEDDSFLANAYRVKFEKEEMDVKIAGDGEEALKMLEEYTPDVIVLDLIMPGKDGFTVMEELQSNEKYESVKDVPVLVASNLGQEEDRKKAMKLGAQGYFIKANIAIDDLVEKIKDAAK